MRSIHSAVKYQEKESQITQESYMSNIEISPKIEIRKGLETHQVQMSNSTLYIR